MKIPFGLADYIIGEGADEIRFDGVSNFQAEGGAVSIEPNLAEVVIADFGESVYDDLINGYSAEVTIVGAEHTLKLMETAMAFADKITDGVTTDTVGLTDSRVGTSLRERGKMLRIHPRDMGTDASLDIVIYKAASVGTYGREFGNEQGTNELTFKMYPRDGADASKGANFFYVGTTDPNAPVA